MSENKTPPATLMNIRTSQRAAGMMVTTPRWTVIAVLGRMEAW